MIINCKKQYINNKKVAEIEIFMLMFSHDYRNCKDAKFSYLGRFF